MSYNTWSNFNLDPALCGQVESKNNTSMRPKVPYGRYHVKITNLELKPSKKGYPMLACTFEVLNNEQYAGDRIYMNSVLLRDGSSKDLAFVSRCNNFLRSLNVVHSDEIFLDQYAGAQGYAQLVERIFNEIKNNNLTFALDYSGETYKEKTFDSFLIEATYSE